MIQSVAILTRAHNKSPKVLAQSFKSICEEINIKADIYYEGTAFLGRLFGLFEKRLFYKRFHFVIRQKIFYFISDQILLYKLRKYDLIVLSECIPNAYWRGYYNIEKIKKILKKPVALYEVYYLGNSITHTKLLKDAGHHGLERFDWNFSVSDIAEIRNEPTSSSRWSNIGLHIAQCGIKPIMKKDIIALIDFTQEGFDVCRREQLEVLKSFPQIKLVYLNGEYSMEEIREIYKNASLFFVQFPEAFGVSIAECLSAGCQIIVKDTNWAMSWRLQNQNKEEYLPECFYVYDNVVNLQNYLQEYISNYNPEVNPFKVYDTFIKYYSNFYYGQKDHLLNSFHQIDNNKMYD